MSAGSYGPYVLPMRGMLAVVVAAVVGSTMLGGCAPAERDYIIGDERFTPSERADIQAGAAWLEAATGERLPAIRWEKLPDVASEMTIARLDMPEGTGGDAELGSFALRIDPAQSAGAMPQVAAHELGHALGLPHLEPGVPGLMAPRVAALTWTPADEAACVARHVCQR